MSNIDHLTLLGKSKNKGAFLRKCPNSVVKCVCECALNLLKGNVPITQRQKIRLIPYKRTLRRLADKKVPLFKKRRLLVQKGEGFLSILIPAAVSLLSTLIHGK
jgi:hypothetical protein